MTNSKRDEIRAALFSSKQFKRKKVKILEQDVEIKQPSVGELTGIGKLDEDKDKNSVCLLMIEYCYVPGTNEKIFTKEDYDGIMGFPSGDWVQTFNRAWMELAGIDWEEAEKNLLEITSASSSSE
ncbi:hypothetical protein LCGC14_0231980 [marine sediment metagenome]|uniref:Uncharacterized protein n=1 Tax=marine sediment metagenome TaxID=412755 RepID=A0A0F9UA66_9ZZZZ